MHRLRPSGNPYLHREDPLLDTPFAARPIADLLGGPLGFNEHAKVVLEGTFNIDSITSSLEACNIVKAMMHHDPSNPLTSESKHTLEKLKEGFSFVKESTASNPKGLHHGHWKC